MTPPTTTPTEIKMPSLGADMESGTLLEWRVAVGDKVARGDIVGLVETQKATMELESFVDGIVEALLVEPGAKVAVGTALARLRAVGEVAAAAAPAPDAAPSPTAAPAPVAAPSPAAAPSVMPVPPSAMPISPPTLPISPTAMPISPIAAMAVPTPTAGLPTAAMATSVPTDERVRSSPAARKRARELDIDLGRVHGSGPHGAIVLRDVIAAPPAPPPAAPAVRVTTAFPTAAAIPPATAMPTPAAAAPAPAAVPAPAGAPAISLTPAKPSPVRDAIAAAMSKSKREIPHYYLAHTISMKRALAWLAETNAKRSIQERVLPAAVLLRAVVEALWEVPELNGFWIDNTFHASESIHLGNAIALRTGGLIAPAIIDADDKTVEEIMRDLHDLVSRARAGRLRASELTFATITVTSLGERGCEAVFPVINPPQVAIIGFGAIVQRPWVENGGVVAAHPTIVATLAADHRVSDGHRGGLFLAALDRALQEPDKW